MHTQEQRISQNALTCQFRPLTVQYEHRIITMEVLQWQRILLLLVAMPFVGLYLLINPNSMSKGLGLLLTVFGVAICIIVFTMK